MEAWWEGLTLLNKGFAVAALFFSVLFVWQFLGALLGLHGDSHGDAGHADHHDSDGAGFTLISVRSVLAFGTLFSWAGTLYLMSGAGMVLAIIYSFAWGVAAMFIVSYLVFKLVQPTGNRHCDSLERHWRRRSGLLESSRRRRGQGTCDGERSDQLC